MVGLSVLLEAREKNFSKSPQVISKVSMIKPYPCSPSSSGSTLGGGRAVSFLDECFLCKQRLYPGKDIYMYNGDRAFCSMECRYRQIMMDEEEEQKIVKRDKCCFVPTPSYSSSSLHCKRNKNQQLWN